MRRLWLKVPGFRVYDIRRDRDHPKRVWVNIRLGDVLAVFGVYVESEKGGYLPVRKAVSPRLFSQNWAMAQVRFLDVPLLHHGVGKRLSLLEDTLALAFMECWGELDRVLKNGLEQTELDFVRPKAWKGMSRRIPVDCVRIWDFERPRGMVGPVSANVQFGHHFVVWHMQVFGDGKFVLDPKHERGVLSSDLRWAADLILRQTSFREFVKGLHATILPEKREFVVKTKGCDIEGIPPPSGSIDGTNGPDKYRRGF